MSEQRKSSGLGFWDGMASALDLGGVRYEERRSTFRDQTDAEAIASDWEAVGNYLRWASEQSGQ